MHKYAGIIFSCFLFLFICSFCLTCFCYITWILISSALSISFDLLIQYAHCFCFRRFSKRLKRVCMYVCIIIYIYIYTHFVCLYECMYEQINTFTIFLFAHLNMDFVTYLVCLHTNVYTYIQVCLHMPIYRHMHIYDTYRHTLIQFMSCLIDSVWANGKLTAITIQSVHLKQSFQMSCNNNKKNRSEKNKRDTNFVPKNINKVDDKVFRRQNGYIYTCIYIHIYVHKCKYISMYIYK